MGNTYQNAKTNADAVHPIVRGRAITASNTTIFAPTRAIYVGTGGTLVVTELDGSTQTTYVGVLGGQWFPVQCVQVLAASTATNLVAGY
jgi:hypothetical protein